MSRAGVIQRHMFPIYNNKYALNSLQTEENDQNSYYLYDNDTFMQRRTQTANIRKMERIIKQQQSTSANTNQLMDTKRTSEYTEFGSSQKSNGQNQNTNNQIRNSKGRSISVNSGGINQQNYLVRRIPERFNDKNANRIDESPLNPLITVQNQDLKNKLQSTITSFSYTTPFDFANNGKNANTLINNNNLNQVNLLPQQLFQNKNEKPVIMTQNKFNEQLNIQNTQNAWRQLNSERAKRLSKINNSYKNGIISVDTPELQDTVFYKEQLNKMIMKQQANQLAMAKKYENSRNQNNTHNLLDEKCEQFHKKTHSIIPGWNIKKRQSKSISVVNRNEFNSTFERVFGVQQNNQTVSQIERQNNIRQRQSGGKQYNFICHTVIQ